ncbi:probable histone-lysine N-methyltransferase set-23 [Cimex lectularius]|uniref:Uncharacterized protein n=1 Tax=Cimex lectularius TaxID=79782 RepID=A0A8I6SB06_CIMLE|nr:probable histone-lysine N-methyltransferase set-23 [Cimex lectularius]
MIEFQVSQSLKTQNMSVVDNYNHPDKKIIYVKECVRGWGIDPEEMNNYYLTRCSCPSTSVGTCNAGSFCICVDQFKPNYKDGRLVEEKMFGNLIVFECGWNTCECAPSCNNFLVQKGPCKTLEIVDVRNKGKGVITKASLEAGTFVCEYTGELIGYQEAEDRLASKDKNNYILTLREHCEDCIIDTCVDARLFGNIGRYLNHSCDPNCILVPVRTGNTIPRICIFAKRNIRKGEELTYHYNSQSENLSSTRCYCRSKKCAGFLPSSSGLDLR